MTAMILDEDLVRDLRRRRKENGADRWDEVWDGVYVMAAMPNDQHQGIVGRLTTFLTLAVELAGRGLVRPGVNVSNDRLHWKHNYRCPDIVVYLNENRAENRDTHWFGGPDLAIEIVSPGEDPHAKLEFYAKVGTRELLIVNRDPWMLELFRLAEGTLQPAGSSRLAEGATAGDAFQTTSVPFTWRLVTGNDRPEIEVVNAESGQTWHA